MRNQKTMAVFAICMFMSFVLRANCIKPDLSVEYVDQSVQLTYKQVGNSTETSHIAFDLKITNKGEELKDLTPVTIKSILLPTYDTISEGYYQKDGISLPTQTYKLNIKKDASTVVTYRAEIPQSKDRFFVGSIVNSSRLVAECNELDNTTDLFPYTGIDLENSKDHRNTQEDLDLYAEIDHQGIVANNGGASHYLRLIRSGNFSKTIESRDVWAIFLAADRFNRKLKIMEYQNTTKRAHKQYWALVWRPEYIYKNYQQEEIRIDRYWQKPSIKGLNPGEYAMLTLMDSQDKVPEVNEANNLDTHPFVVTPLEFSPDIDNPTTWFVDRVNEPVKEQVWTLRNVTAQTVDWEVEAICPNTLQPADWLEVSPRSGQLAPFNPHSVLTEAKVTIKILKQIPTNMKEALIIFKPRGLEQYSLKQKIHWHELKNFENPLLEFSKLDFHFAQTIPQTGPANHPGFQTVKLTNPGDTDVFYEPYTDAKWITLRPHRVWNSTTNRYETKVPKGGSALLDIIIHPAVNLSAPRQGLQAGIYNAEVKIMSNVTNDHQKFRVQYFVPGKLSQYDPSKMQQPGKLERYGNGCGQSGFYQPTFMAKETLSVYRTTQFSGTKAPANSRGTIFASVDTQLNQIFPGCQMYLDPSVLVPIKSIQSDAKGNWQTTMSTLIQPSMVGMKGHMQVIFADGNQTYLTNGLKFEVGREL